jgi:hypothetical protein
LLFAAFGLIVAVEPDPFVEPLGVDQQTGIFWIVAGLVLVVVGWLSPTVVSSQQRRSVVHDDAERIE